MKKETENTIVNLSNFGYISGCIVLYLVALCILISAVWSIIHDMYTGVYTVYKILDEVGLIVFAMAVIDVGKYLMLEEVLRRERAHNPKQSRKTLTKFAIIIASALSLEGLVLTIEVAKQDVNKLLYPVSVLLTATFYIIGIGIYQKLNASAEKD
ncbi:general glycosylation pathway protein [Simkania sp.]|uniref:general glycosylation pathway protein n=1 Tax=Simkania sp. TaxID=34094 RepID=UPI003B5177F4